MLLLRHIEPYNSQLTTYDALERRYSQCLDTRSLALLFTLLLKCFAFQLVTFGANRIEALTTMANALDSYVIRGSKTKTELF